MTGMEGTESITADELAQRIGGRVEGDETRSVRTVRTLDEAGAEDLSWVESPRYRAQAAASRAGVLLIDEHTEPLPDRTVIRVPDPNLALCRALALLAPPKDVIPPGVHPTARIGRGAVVEGVAVGPNVYIGDGATIGPGTVLYPGVFVGREARIGKDCTLWPNVVVRERVRIGDRVIIHPNATIGADGFGYLQREGRHVKIPQIGTVVIEDDVEIGANATIDRAKCGVTRIGRGAKIDNLVMIAHNCEVGEGSILVAQVGIAGSTKLGRYVMLGGQVGVIDHRTIGDGVQMAAKSAAYNDFPPGAVLRGIPARDHNRFGREQVALGKLPDLLKKVKALERRVAELEQRVNGE
ncbi:MAG: UDP-3-O-(3-hydroxymyristoyl)glucosamine N-acyltransferase [Planctomycetota bacterium]|nr:MAG: UDP-3-O-(3-hydroxymyristoyl)glucosamine N-acyltransferase [Planctomycetota bacterium]